MTPLWMAFCGGPVSAWKGYRSGGAHYSSGAEKGRPGPGGIHRNYDGVEIGVGDLQVKEAEIEEAYQLVEPEFLAALKQIMINIKEFHLKQLPKSWWDLDEEGNVLGQLYRPLKRVGLYIPGGRAAYPSSVLMTAVPGMVAGVEELVMVSPPDREGRLNPYTLVAASEAGVQSIFKVGGAQAIAALAYGTESIRPVDKIVGPGNIYVTAAKKLVYGQVDIDMLAGPSEILIVADSSADPVFLAADLLAQLNMIPWQLLFCHTGSNPGEKSNQ